MPATKGEATKEAIRRRAMADFRLHGYEGTGLAQIAMHLGISRAAVLHHYGSKLGLLHAVLDPYLDGLTQLLSRYEDTDVISVGERRDLVAEFLDLCLAHSEAAGILSWDITSRAEPSVAERVRRIGGRFYALITGLDATVATRLVAEAVLAVVVRPLTDLSTDPDDPQTRAVILEVANVVIDQLEVDAI